MARLTFRALWPVLITAALFAPPPAVAGDGGRVAGGIFGALIRGAMIDGARKSWQKLDEAIINCMVQQHRINPDQLIEQGISASDYRLQQYIESCRQAVAQEQYQREQAERERALREEDEQRREEEAARARQVQLENEREAAEAAELERERIKQAERQAANQRRQQLVAQFSATQADAIITGNLALGMTSAAVLAARGEPTGKEVIPPSEELWTYGRERVVLSKGRVTYIGQ